MKKLYKHTLKLKSLELEHFRRFENLQFRFDEHLAVLIGENGAGKTTILDAVGCSLQKFISSFYRQREEFEITSSDVKIGTNKLGIKIQFEAEYSGYNYDLFNEHKESDVNINEHDDKYYFEQKEEKTLVGEFDKEESSKIGFAEEDIYQSMGADYRDSINNLLISKKNISFPIVIFFRSESEADTRIKTNNDISEIKPADILKIYDRIINPEIHTFNFITEWFRWQEGLQSQKERNGEIYNDIALKAVKKAIYNVIHDNHITEEELNKSIYVD